MEETSMYVQGSRSPREGTQRVSPPTLGKDLNNQAEQMGFVVEQRKQKKKTLAEEE